MDDCGVGVTAECAAPRMARVQLGVVHIHKIEANMGNDVM